MTAPSANPDEQRRASTEIHNAALRRLRNNHPDEYRSLVAEERYRVLGERGLPREEDELR